MDKPKPFSMIREFHLADWLTLGNACAGMGALFAVMSFLQSGDVVHLQYACALIPLALAFDVLDGRIARWRQKSSALGRELDSLADIISFGVAPAAIACARDMASSTAARSASFLAPRSSFRSNRGPWIEIAIVFGAFTASMTSDRRSRLSTRTSTWFLATYPRRVLRPLL